VQLRGSKSAGRATHMNLKHSEASLHVQNMPELMIGWYQQHTAFKLLQQHTLRHVCQTIRCVVTRVRRLTSNRFHPILR
jgi:hypothetical protein